MQGLHANQFTVEQMYRRMAFQTPGDSELHCEVTNEVLYKTYYFSFIHFTQLICGNKGQIKGATWDWRFWDMTQRSTVDLQRNKKQKQIQWPLVRKRTIPTERQPLVGEI
jgi:hypothetical protein